MKNKIGIYLGRFQPPTKAHLAIIKQMSGDGPGTVYIVEGKKSNPKKNPWTGKERKDLLKKMLPSNIKVEIVPTGFYPGICNKSKHNDFALYCGSDRIATYEKQEQYLEPGKTISYREVKRTDEDISATRLRRALQSDNEKVFREMAPKEIWDQYETMKGKY